MIARRTLAVLIVMAVLFGLSLALAEGDWAKAAVLFAAWVAGGALLIGLMFVLIHLWYGGDR